SMPMFYRDPVVLNAKEHANLKLLAQRKYSFANTANSVPVVVGEVPGLMAHSPVVFTAGPEPMLVTLLGLHADQNLFVDEAGNWLEGCFIPAYVRRYPFILTRVTDDNLLLGADIDAEAFGADGAPLFDNGQATDVARDVFRFCAEYQQAWDLTRKFCKEVYDAGLLKEQTCTVRGATGAGIRLTGFSVVDEEALDALDNRTANDWRKRHLLKHLYFHLASMDRLNNLAALNDKRQAAASLAARASMVEVAKEAAV
ncbi:MAG: SapC family protein, partial [Rhizomicrobium sp.]